MRKIYSFLLLMIALQYASFARAQTEEIIGEDTVISGVVIYSDPRLDILMESNTKAKKAYAAAPGKTAKVIRSGKGYRVQIYIGNNKSAAINAKVAFMKKYPDIKTYMTYTQPQYRVKVGNFQTRGDAQAFIPEIRAIYPAAMIVPDYIVINTFKKQ